MVQNLLNRREDEAALRDAVALARPGQDGPAGRVYSAFRTLCGPGDPFRAERLAAVATDLMTPLDLERAGELPPRSRRRRARPAGPVVAAAAAEAVAKIRADAEPLALWFADAALARALGWPVAVPLLAGELFVRRRRGRGGDRGPARPAGASSSRSATPAPRSPPSTSPKTCPAAPPGSLTPRQSCGQREGEGARGAARRRRRRRRCAAPRLTDRARRRLFERLVALGAARELTGRATFRLYGL